MAVGCAGKVLFQNYPWSEMITTAQPHSVIDFKSKSKQADPNEKSTGPTEHVLKIVQQLSGAMHTAINEIREINENAKLLSLNARIEAARAGSSGAAFGVVAQEMQGLSNKTANVADQMANRTQESITNLVGIIGGNVRGTRLTDIALNSVDLIDRNLYERTCDVRWWATDSSLVDALQVNSPASIAHASKRMGVILNAYTVYHDLVLCDATGRVIANGRPNQFKSVGRDEAKSPWFTRALATSSGNDFAFQTAHQSQLVSDESVLIYSATVRRNGEANERTLGVLGVVFNWEALSSAVLCNESLDARESEKTLRLIVDNDAHVLASSRPLPFDFKLPMQKLEGLFNQNNGYILDEMDRKRVCIAHAKSPGFETYATGWHAILIQDIE